MSEVYRMETGTVRGQYGMVTLLPGDTGRLTYGRAQTTLGSGNLHEPIEGYRATVGARFRAWLPALAARSAAADTDFGNATARFVRALQRTRALPETGIADAGLARKLIATEA